MKSFIKGIFGSKDETVRKLDHPRDLILGDMLQMSDSFGLPPRLRKQIFKVTGIATYQFEHEYATCFTLLGENQDEIDVTIENSAGREHASFSLAINRDIVEQLFDLDDFALIFEDEPLTLKPIAQLDFEPWLAEAYHVDSRGERGYYYEKDCRGKGPSPYEGDGEPFDFYGLASSDGKKALEVEVYEGGETEVFLVLNRDTTDIADLWPAAK